MNKPIFSIVLLIAATLGSCLSAKKHFERADFDRAIEISARKLRKDPSDQKHIDIITESYRIANERDHAEIARLMGEGREDNWEKIYRIYRVLNHRQDIIRLLPKLRPQNGLSKTVEFEIRDYSMEMAKSREKAVDNYIKRGDDAMAASSDRFMARRAYDYYLHAERLNNEYPGMEQKKKIAYHAGRTHVLVRFHSDSPSPAPPELESSILAADLSHLNDFWVEVSSVEQGNISYHYTADIQLSNIIVSPERVRERMYEEKKSVEDGWEYEKNPDGSIKRDSLNKPIKKKVYRNVSARVVEIEQYRESILSGQVILIDHLANRNHRSEEFFGKAAFNNLYGFAVGDNRALSEHTLNLLQGKPMPFPSTGEMVMRATASFGSASYDRMRSLIRQFVR